MARGGTGLTNGTVANPGPLIRISATETAEMLGWSVEELDHWRLQGRGPVRRSTGDYLLWEAKTWRDTFGPARFTDQAAALRSTGYLLSYVPVPVQKQVQKRGPRRIAQFGTVAETAKGTGRYYGKFVRAGQLHRIPGSFSRPELAREALDDIRDQIEAGTWVPPIQSAAS